MRYAIVSNPRDRIATGLPGAGSVAIVSYHLGRCLAARSHEVTLVAGRGARESAQERLEDRLQVIRVRPRLARLHKYRERLASIFERVPPHFLSKSYFIEFFLGAALKLRKLRPDVIHIQNHGQAAPLFRALCPGARIVVHLHDPSLAHVNARVARRVLSQADLIVTCSEYVAQCLKQAHPELGVPIRMINNGVNVEDFRPPAAAANSTRETRLLYVGRISPEKGVHVLIEAFNEITRRVPGARLDIVGSAALFPYSVVKLFRRDPHWAALTSFYGRTVAKRLLALREAPGTRYMKELQRAQSEEAAGATRFLGEQSHEAIAGMLQRADILVVPSVCDEPFGLPAAEAMAAGVAVVASKAGGLAEIVRHGETGLLVPRSDPSALASAVAELAAQPERRREMGRAGRTRVSTSFTWEHATLSLVEALSASGITTPDHALRLY